MSIKTDLKKYKRRAEEAQDEYTRALTIVESLTKELRECAEQITCLLNNVNIVKLKVTSEKEVLSLLDRLKPNLIPIYKCSNAFVPTKESAEKRAINIVDKGLDMISVGDYIAESRKDGLFHPHIYAAYIYVANIIVKLELPVETPSFGKVFNHTISFMGGYATHYNS